ncbi:tagaturonate epimerase family protein [Thermotoga caldifontis]|uniref:tagaturonate epimerase family protein n=1 Tax=Thermotoga caldifontis TaxID=1508419 RepID=UPI0005972959|nr:tagaturonate epimerase family protein [Thermotoga caldifontis]
MSDFLQRFERLTQFRMKPYASSVRKTRDATFFLVRDDRSKYLVVIGKRGICERFEGQKIGEIEQDDVLLCPMNNKNCETLTEFLPSLKPATCTMKLSFGFGDRLGVATAAHAQCVNKEKCFPVFAQQSVREITRTERTWSDVLYSAIWGVFESGYDGLFGADADHVKKIEDLEKAARVGYTMFTIDPSDHIKDPAKFDRRELARFYEEHPLRRAIETRYVGKSFTILGERLTFDEEEFAELFVTYIDAIDHVEECYKALRATIGGSFDLEVSIDETSLPTTPLAHIFFVQELVRRGVEFQTLALRFPGEWQKGIDYIGDIDLFAEELDKHVAIVKMFTGYKLSLHSGSDKFSVYPILAEKTEGTVHVKTAGTSYLEAIRVVAKFAPDLYREIHKFALSRFEQDRASYHVTTDLSKIPDVDSLSDDELVHLLDQPDSRQLIHITYGSVLTAKKDGKSLFKERIMKVLFEHETDHYAFLRTHLGKHLKLLGV